MLKTLYFISISLIFVATLRADPEKVQESLVRVLKSIEQIETQISQKQSELKQAVGEKQREDIQMRIEQLVNENETLKRNFDEIATQIDSNALSQVEQRLTLADEFRELVAPIVSELKRLSNRPREIERLRSELGSLNAQLSLFERGIKNLQVLLEQPNQRPVIQALEQSIDRWTQRKQRTETEISITRHKLEQRLSETGTLSESLESLVQIFFRSRGRNLLLAILAGVFGVFLMRQIQVRLLAQNILARRSLSLPVRLLNVGLFLSAGLVGVAAFLLVLYYSGDWVLLTLALFLLLGLLWASKQALPRFSEQIMLLLNLGVVREGERVIWNGVPWRVKLLRFFAVLENPDLRPTTLRLPVADLMGLRSRSYDSNEPWFPSRIGDYVLLSDGSFGRVEEQSVEQVVLKQLGDSLRSFQVPKYLELSPLNLSNGFRVSINFGVTYQLQAEVTSKVLNKLRELLYFKLKELEIEYKALSVEFEEAQASSLSLLVSIDLAGNLAPKYHQIKRQLWAICVDVATAEGWELPFNQMDLHLKSSKVIF